MTGLCSWGDAKSAPNWCGPQLRSLLKAVTLCLIVGILVISHISALELHDGMDFLEPYTTHHGPRHKRHRQTRECQHIKYGNVTFSKHRASHNDSLILPLVDYHYYIKQVGQYWDQRTLYINHQVVKNPLSTFSVLEPGHKNGCSNNPGHRETVQNSAKQKNCILASNAGFFNITSDQCLGNIVSDKFLVQDSGGIQNVHFGVTEDGNIFTGYLSELDVLLQDFSQLVGGVLWLVRDGESYVDESAKIECPDTETTGTFERFISVVSARTAVGHDADGRIHMIQVEGKTDELGVNLREFADILIDLGIVNAINLDGGGSTTTVVNSTLRNYPPDKCVNSSYNCPRAVSTILCVHEPVCSPSDCSGHGECVLGLCRCDGLWTGDACDQLLCPADCSGHGTCTPDGCVCLPGWQGGNCSIPCTEGTYGLNCSLPCICENGASCDKSNGTCHCPPGFSGKYCQSACPFGFYGVGCSQVCRCNSSCYCHHVSGLCNVSLPDGDYLKAGKCLANQRMRELNLVPQNTQQITFCITSVPILAVIAVASLLLNVLLSILLSRMRQRHRKEMVRQARLAVKRALRRFQSRTEDSSEEDNTEGPVKAANGYKKVPTVSDSESIGSGNEEELFLAPKKKKSTKH
ncbi:N-acetylglucosamine-1-phosphodiester alpha-N-acetylglucosaminidase isoform X2 [Aplysia californica]|uniref:N-acetylglucosamine-1-phosphodiester alpha-N-acetylglucosaminidase isoform X2 n=1 Tax=Aplysia californica TaxID=6500 RepID=A0ABM0JK81_APLCA|nr:N-acetylglucosamine-1-phosphodiester alpha-N-acetylglucosaminidase isoform X2 [Aplysia californica]